MPKPSTDGISARLLQCLDRSAGKTQAALARFCSVSTAAVAQWVKNGSISDENLRKAAEFLGVNEQWLKTGEGPKDADGGVRSIGEFDEIPEGYSVVPEYEYRFSAGGGANNGKSIPELQQEESKPKEKDWYVKKEGKPAIYRDSFFCSYHTTPSKCVRAKVRATAWSQSFMTATRSFSERILITTLSTATLLTAPFTQSASKVTTASSAFQKSRAGFASVRTTHDMGMKTL